MIWKERSLFKDPNPDQNKKMQPIDFTIKLQRKSKKQFDFQKPQDQGKLLLNKCSHLLKGTNNLKN